MVTLSTRNLHDFLQDPFFQHGSIGFDRIFEMFERSAPQGNYPPYNIKKLDKHKFVVELALAGFSEDELNVEFEKNMLSVEGNSAKEGDYITNPQLMKKDKLCDYIHQGIANRKFKRSWTLADHVEVKGCTFENGMLNIFLEEVIPEHEKPRKIEIGGSFNNFTKKFLAG